jgi:hypothetical protein
MSHYFINNHATDEGTHEVHALGCKRMPTDKRYLGNFYQLGEALLEARKEFWQSGGCDSCARHTGDDTVRARRLMWPERQIV